MLSQMEQARLLSKIGLVLIFNSAMWDQELFFDEVFTQLGTVLPSFFFVPCFLYPDQQGSFFSLVAMIFID
jgi:hypothetical protein